MRKKPTFYYYSGGSEALPQATEPSPLIANSLDTTTANLSWNDTGADNYVLQRATQSDYSDAAEIYSGALLTFADSGLTMGTPYYYRVKAQLSGYADSAWVTASKQTFSFSPAFFYDYTGLVFNTNNSYGTCNNGVINAIKPLINTGAQTLTFTNTHSIDLQTGTHPYSIGSSSNGYADAATPITLSGDFTAILRFYHEQTFSFSKLFHQHDGANYQFSFSDNTTFVLVIGGNVYSRTWPSTLDPLRMWDVVFQRTSDQFRIGIHDRVAGTISWSASTTVSTADFVFRRFFSDNTLVRYFLSGVSRVGAVASSLSDAQISEWFNYGYGQSYTFPAEYASGNLRGLTFAALSSGYFSNSVLNSGMDSTSWKKIVTIGDKTFMNVTKPKGGTTYGQDVIHVYDHSNGQGAYKELANYNTSTDAHETGSIFNASDRLGRIRHDPFYGLANSYTSLRMSYSGKDFDFSGFTTIPNLSGVATMVDNQSGYSTVVKRGNTLVKLSQEFSPVGFARWLTIEVSYDLGQSWKDKYRIADTAASPDWWYPYLLDGGDNSTVYVVMMNYNTTKYRFCASIKSTDLYTWTNLTGSFSKDVRLTNPLTLTEAKTNCLLGTDATSLAGGTRLLDAHTTTDGKFYCLMSNGNETGFELLYDDGAGVFTTKAVGVDGKTVELNHFYDGVVWKTGANTYNVGLFEVVGGNRFPIQLQTTDGGDTWAYIGRITTDSVNMHYGMMITRNIDHIDYGSIGTVRDIDGTNGNAYIKEIKAAGVYI